jgi:glycosyltransferase involved in cell wall biosynthesis
VADAGVKAARPRVIAMVGTSARGGIASVIAAYGRSRLATDWPLEFITTHTDGGALRKLWFAARGFAHFVSLVARRRVALLHVHGASNASFWRKLPFVVVARVTSTPYVFHLHGGGFIDFHGARGALGRGAIRSVLDHAACVIVLSERWKNSIAALTDNDRIVVIGNPIDDPALCELTAERVRSGTTLLFMGALLDRKGIGDLVRAMPTLRQALPATRLTVAGDGDIDRVRNMARAAGVEDAIEVVGWISGIKKLDVFERACMLVLPSYTENLPVVVLEAMAAALPVVATRVGGVPDLVQHGVTGLLFDPGDHDALRENLLQLLRDSDARVRMGQAGRRRALEEFSMEHAIDRLSDVYRAIGLGRLDAVTPARQH